MADTDDALKHFINSTDDPYTLLDLPNGPASTEKEIRSAWKKTALKFHPDKLRASATSKDAFDEATANSLYILRQDAYGILSESHLREQYDNALRAKEQKKQRDAAFSGKRKAMKEDLERREGAAKRQKREEVEGKVELERLRADGQRRRRERAEKLRRQAEEEERVEREREEGVVEKEEVKVNGAAQRQVQEIDRVVKLRFAPCERTEHVTRERLKEMFSRFGTVEAVTLKEKKIKVDGEKHRKLYLTVAVIFENIVAAHAAVSDFEGIAENEQGDWQLLDAPEWASGQQPDFLANPKSHIQGPQQAATPLATNGLTNAATGGDADDILMIRLKNAEKKRREDKKRMEEEAAASANAAIEKGGQGSMSPPEKVVPTFASFKAKNPAVPGSDDDAGKRREVERKRLEEEMRREEAQEDLKMDTGEGDSIPA